jgi:hypothetical protein
MAQKMTVEQLMTKFGEACSRDEANEAARIVCRDPKVLGLLTGACVASGIELIGGVGLTAFGLTLSVETGGALPAVTGGAAATVGWDTMKDGGVGLKYYCQGAVAQARRWATHQFVTPLKPDPLGLPFLDMEQGKSDSNK